MSKVKKRKYKQARIEFKRELREKMDDNVALAMLVVETYSAWHHRRHIVKIWDMLRNPDYEAFRVGYSKELMGKHLTGRDEIWRSLWVVEMDLVERYRYKIPQKMAMGDALGVAYQVLKKK